VLDAYALYFKKFVEAYAKEGIRVEQVHVQNEPRSNQKFPSCLWTGEEMRDFIRDHIGPLFEREEVPCEIWAGTIEKGGCLGTRTDAGGTQGYAEWAHCILSDPDARKYVGGLGFQWDGKGMIQQTHLTWPDVPLIQTENECGDGKNTWSYARYVFELMWHYFTNGVSAYTYWNMILPEGGGSSWGWKQNAMISVTDSGKAVFNPEFYVMQHVAQFVRPGAARLGLKGPWSAFALAFRNTDGSTVIVVANPYETPGKVNLDTVDGTVKLALPPGSLNTMQL
jgi:glucosylceramidase